jgi:hypothetical protein
MMFRQPVRVVFLALAALAAAPAAAAQGFGVGPRLSFVRGDVPSETPSTRFVGGIVRMRSSRRVVLEVAADYRTERSEDGLMRVRERPLQGSMLLFPVRSTLAPYLLAGYGLYNRTTETFEVEGAPMPTASISERRTGAHMGFGAELFLGRHVAFVLDYRYRFVRFGAAQDGEEPVNLPGLGGRLSHRGSMWTSGLAFYF